MLLFNLMLGTWEEHHRPQWTGITFKEFSNTKNNDNNYTMVKKTAVPRIAPRPMNWRMRAYYIS